MSVSKDELNAMLGFDPQGRSGTDVNEWFRPSFDKDTNKDKRYTIRLLPQEPGNNLPFIAVRMHDFGSGKDFTRGVCPSQNRENPEDCPACQRFFALIGQEEFREDDTLRKILLRIAPTNRVYAQVVDRGDGDKVKLWSIPPGGFKNLKTEVDAQVEFDINVANPEEGKDLVLTVTRLPMGAPFLKSFSAAPKPSPVGFDWEDQTKDIIGAAHRREFSADDVLEFIPDELGEFYGRITELYEKYSGNIVEGLEEV